MTLSNFAILFLLLAISSGLKPFRFDGLLVSIKQLLSRGVK